MDDFFVGQKVVCVDPDGPDAAGRSKPFTPDEALLRGKIYTITRIFSASTTCFHLAEVRRSKEACAQWGFELGYGCYRFRPLESKAISIFRAIAANPHIDILEDA